MELITEAVPEVAKKRHQGEKGWWVKFRDMLGGTEIAPVLGRNYETLHKGICNTSKRISRQTHRSLDSSGMDVENCQITERNGSAATCMLQGSSRFRYFKDVESDTSRLDTYKSHC